MKLPSYIILKILVYNTVELIKYRYIFTNNIIKMGLCNKINTDFFKMHYITEILGYKDALKIRTDDLRSAQYGYKNNIVDLDILLSSSNIQVVKFAANMGAKNFNMCFYSNSLTVVKYGKFMGASNYNLCYYSNNLEVVKFGYKGGAKYIDICMRSENIEIVRWAIIRGATDYSRCLYSKNSDVIKIGVENNAKFIYPWITPRNLLIIKILLKKDIIKVIDSTNSLDLDIIRKIDKYTNNMDTKKYLRNYNIDIIIYALNKIKNVENK